MVIDQRFPCPTATLKSVDGLLEEAIARLEKTDDHPLLVGAGETWTGPDDASLDFGLARDGKFLYLSAHVTDEQVIERGDALELRVVARFIDQRRNDPQLGRGSYVFRVSAPDAEHRTTLDVTALRGGKKF